jgi:hypothetical protein
MRTATLVRESCGTWRCCERRKSIANFISDESATVRWSLMLRNESDVSDLEAREKARRRTWPVLNLVVKEVRELPELEWPISPASPESPTTDTVVMLLVLVWAVALT